MESHLEALTKKLNAAEQRLELISNTVLIGIWDWDVVNNKLVWNDAMFELFGVVNTGTPVDYEFFEKCLVGEDAVRVRQVVNDCILTGQLYKYVFKLKSRPGVSVYGTGRCYYDSDGKPYRFLGINLEMPKICTRCDCLFN